MKPLKKRKLLRNIKRPQLLIISSIILISLAALLVYSMINPSSQANSDDEFVVLATTGIIADTTANITGDVATVETLVPAGADPHTYQPTADDIEQIRTADLVLYNGLGLEAQMTDALEGIGDRAVPVGEGVDQERLLPWEEGEGKNYDPHIWTDVQVWSQVAQYIGTTLQQRDPENAKQYADNTLAYLEELSLLDQEVLNAIATIPEERRYLVSTHDAFGYFSKAYDIESRALLGISTESEAGTRDVDELATFIVQNDIPAIFGENITSDRFAQSVIEAAEAQGHTVEIGDQLYTDALGEPGTPQDSYIGLIRSNTESIVNALSSEQSTE